MLCPPDSTQTEKARMDSKHAIAVPLMYKADGKS
jgi:hypothetical protein